MVTYTDIQYESIHCLRSCSSRLNEIARCIPLSGELSHISKRGCCQHVVGCVLVMDSPHVCCSFIARLPMARSWPALHSLRVHCVFTVGLLFERSTVISMCVADPRLTVRPMLVHAQCSKGQHRAQSWFAHCPVVVRSLFNRSSPSVYSQ